jgi:hypothetical protein
MRAQAERQHFLSPHGERIQGRGAWSYSDSKTLFAVISLVEMSQMELAHCSILHLIARASEAISFSWPCQDLLPVQPRAGQRHETE